MVELCGIHKVMGWTVAVIAKAKPSVSIVDTTKRSVSGLSQLRGIPEQAMSSTLKKRFLLRVALLTSVAVSLRAEA